ncbi:triose-phosphate isomerase [Patescibacteria group bacterium]|nr:triose-phosphate isomerase [Patescibacteria group bacterium]
MSKNKKIIIANWKMNPVSTKEAKKLFLGIKITASKLKNVQTVVCPPFVYLNELVSEYKGHRIAIGAQDSFSENAGSFTGMVSPKMLKNSGVEYVIIGHSERRALGEDNKMINEKTKASIKSGLKVILCVGERSRDEQGKQFSFIKKELVESLDGIAKGSLKNIFVAYEPIWAISNNSKNKAMSSNDIHEMTIFIKKVLTDKFGVGMKIAGVLYGGSAGPLNTKDILENGNADGLLVGRSSLDAKKFNRILETANNIE